MKPIIAVDIDDVLSRSAEGFAAFSNREWQSGITADDYSEEWAVVWKIPLEDAIERAHQYHMLGAMGQYAHFEDAIPVIKKLQERFELVIVTSRRDMVKPETEVWLKKYFDGMFTAVHYVGMWDASDDVMQKLRANKTAVCLAIGATYLIDDQVKHCAGAADAGIETILFGDYRWNKTMQNAPRITKVRNWKEVGEYFDGR